MSMGVRLRYGSLDCREDLHYGLDDDKPGRCMLASMSLKEVAESHRTAMHQLLLSAFPCTHLLTSREI